VARWFGGQFVVMSDSFVRSIDRVDRQDQVNKVSF
jgi:hypothetical protein